MTIFSADGEEVVPVDMREAPPIDGRFVSLGRYSFEKNGQGYVLISNEGTTGHVIADAVLFLPVDQADRAIASSPSAGGRREASREGGRVGRRARSWTRS